MVSIRRMAWIAAFGLSLLPAPAVALVTQPIDAASFGPRLIGDTFFDRQRASPDDDPPMVVFEVIEPWVEGSAPICRHGLCGAPTYSYPAYLPLAIDPMGHVLNREDFLEGAVVGSPRYFPRGELRRSPVLGGKRYVPRPADK